MSEYFLVFNDSTESEPLNMRSRIALSMQLPSDWQGNRWEMQCRQGEGSSWGPVRLADGPIPSYLEDTSAQPNSFYQFSSPIINVHEIRLAGATQQTCQVSIEVVTRSCAGGA